MIDAQTAFTREQRRRRREHALAVLRRRRGGAGCLESLEGALGTGAPAARRATGLRPIPLDSIVGTAEDAKTRTFDGRFRPGPSSRRRWEGIWISARRGAAWPPISVYRLGERHFVRDGHHRVSVARSLGMAAIDAEVTELDYGSGPSAG